jgi:predicted RNase H-like HicB family nuclease
VRLEEPDVGQTPERVLYPFTFIFKQEDSAWCALACEVNVASCGNTPDDAREGLKEAVELYLSYMIEHGRRDEIARPTPKEDLAEICQGDYVVEYYAALVDITTQPVFHLGTEFLRSELTPANCDLALAR